MCKCTVLVHTPGMQHLAACLLVTYKRTLLVLVAVQHYSVIVAGVMLLAVRMNSVDLPVCTGSATLQAQQALTVVSI